MGRFQKHIFICNNQRKEDDPRGCCTARGSVELMDYLKQRVHDSGLKGKVRVNKAGCLDACAHGPTMVGPCAQASRHPALLTRTLPLRPLSWTRCFR